MGGCWKEWFDLKINLNSLTPKFNVKRSDGGVGDVTVVWRFLVKWWGCRPQ
jgi:hypothetical protein